MSARAPARSGRALAGALAATLAYPCSAAATSEPPATTPSERDSTAPAPSGAADSTVPSGAAEAEGPAFGWNFDGVWLTPLIGPAYTPELGFVIAAGGMVSFVADEKSPRSSFPATIGYGTVGALVASGQLRSYFFQDTWRLDADLWYKDMTDHYFGVGYDAGKNTALGDDTTKYHRQWFQVKPTVLRRVVSDLFVGVVADLNQTIATDLNPQMAMDPHVIADGANNLNLGAGPVLRFDSRDFPQNAFHGLLFQASYVPYLSKKGQHDGYQILDLDYRQYLSLGREGSTLAWTLRSRMGFGDVPWSELGMLGSPFDLRGYRWGRYRQKTVAYGIAEYRFNFSAGSKPGGAVELSRHGLVGWLGVGTLGDDLGSLEGALPNIGVGYRFAVQDRLNARFDIGVGRESQALYFNFTEAF